MVKLINAWYITMFFILCNVSAIIKDNNGKGNDYVNYLPIVLASI